MRSAVLSVLVLVLALALLCPAVLCQSTLYATWLTASSSPLGPPNPPARCLSSLVAVNGQPELVLLGGKNAAGAMGDVWLGFVDSSQGVTWVLKTHNSSVPQPSARYGQTAQLDLNSAVLMYGGVDQAGRYLDDVWSLDPTSAAWSVIRVPSFQRQPTTAAPSLYTVQPSARAFMHWRPFTLTFGLLRRLQSSLVTQNLDAFLNTTSGAHDSSVLNTLLLFGGRSSPGDIFSTDWSNQPLPATNVSDPSPFNADFGDQWMYVYAADTWLRIGNATCVEQEEVCADYTSVASLSPQIPGLLSALHAYSTFPVRPAALLNRTIALLDTTLWLEQVLYGVDQQIRSNPALTEDHQDTCTDVCLQFAEVPSPTVATPPTQCTTNGNSGASISGGGSVFCNSSTVGNVITQTRPNASEGAAMATHQLVNGSSTLTYVWMFGGFICASGGVDIFSVTSWGDECFVQALSVLIPGSLVWYTFTPPLVVNSQYVTWPSGRAYAAMAIDQTSSTLWLYGGAATGNNEWTYLNDLYAFDIVSRAWLTTIVTSTSPVAGIGANLVWLPATATTPSGLYLYGGCSDSGYSDQLLLLQTSSTIAAYNWQASGAALSLAQAGVQASFTLTAKSVSANGTITNTSEPLTYAVGLASYFFVTVTATDSEGNTFVEASVVPTEVDNGVYSVNYTVDYGSLLAINVGFLENDVYVPIPHSPFSLRLLPNAYSASSTIISSSNYSTVEKGTQTFIVIQLRDQYHNALIASPGKPPPKLSMYYHSAPLTDNTAAPGCLLIESKALNGGGSGNMSGGSNTTNSTTEDPSGNDVVFYQLDVSQYDNKDGTFTLLYLVPPVNAYYLYVLVDCAEIVDSPFAVSALDALVLPAALQSTFLALSCILGSVVFGMVVVLVLYRNNRVIRAGSPVFLVLICLGVLLCIASVPIYAYPSATSCRLFPFLLTTGYIIALAALCSKSYRVLLIFVKHELDSAALSDTGMMVPVITLLACETVINLVWLVVSPLGYVEFADSSTSVQTYHACAGEHQVAFISASVAFNSLVALWGVWLALQIRQVPDALGESKLMGAALYNLALVMAITIPLTWTASNTQSSHEDVIIPAAAILWCSFVTIALVIAPKLYYILHPPAQHFFDSDPTAGGAANGVKDDKQHGSGSGSKESTDDDEPNDGNGASFPPSDGGLPVSSSPVKGDAGRSSPLQPTHKRQLSAGAAAVGASSSQKSREASPKQRSPAHASSAARDRQHTAPSSTSIQQVHIDIHSPAPLSVPAAAAVRLMSHEHQNGTAAAGDAMANALESSKAARSAAASLDSLSPHTSKKRSAHSRTAPTSHNESTRRAYTASPAMHYSHLSIPSPYPSSPLPSSPLPASTTATPPIATMRTSLSVDDLGYMPTRPPTAAHVHLPPGPTLSMSHTGSPVRSTAPVQNGMRMLTSSAHRVSISGRPSPQLGSAGGGGLYGEQLTPLALASTPTAMMD